MAEREPDVVNHSLSASQHGQVENYYSGEAEIIQNLQDMGELFYNCIHLLEGPSGILTTTKQIKLGDKIAGNNRIIDLNPFLKNLKTIHDNIYKGVTHVSKMSELKRRVNKIIKKDKVWKTKLGRLDGGEMECSTSLKVKLARIAICSGGALIGAVTVGAALGALFGFVTVSLTAICGIGSGIMALGAVGLAVGAGVAALGIWVYDAVKIGKIRNKSFIAFHELQQHIDETMLMAKLNNLVLTLEGYCSGIIEVMKATNVLVDESPNSSVLSQGERTALQVARKDADQLLPELTDIYQSKMAELGENSPEMEEGTRHLVAMNVAVEMCRYKMKNEGSSKEEIGNFINQKLMPALKP